MAVDVPAMVGQVLPQSYNSGFIVLSYVVSYVGAITTLELLNRRTSGRGIVNWFLLVAAAVTMGGISIWSMHMIGNRAIILSGYKDARLEINYNIGFTVLSFFVPIIVLLFAFSLAGVNDRVSKVRVVLGGAFAGLAICGMHYLGQAGIANYVCIYDIGHVVGAAIIAVAASIVALFVFFSLRAAWKDSWYKRALCAVLLASAVSGMHWTAATGTRYRLRSVNEYNNVTSVNRTVIIVIVFALVACTFLFALSVLTQRHRSQQSNRAQQVTVACAYFDQDGKVMVTSEGMLPSRKITNSFMEKSFDDIFSPSHPVFLWIYRASRNWSGIMDLVPGIRAHIRAFTTEKARSESFDLDGKRVDDYSMLFRQLFVVAASDLAQAVSLPLERVGVLHDQIVNTGATQGPRKRRLMSVSSDIETGDPSHFVFGRGQMLFLLRKTNKEESARLQAGGFRFANVANVIDILSRSMQVNKDELQRHLDSMQHHSPNEHILEPGVHVCCFALRASIRSGFDVLVRQHARNQLPSVQLPLAGLDENHLRVLRKMNGLTVGQCMALLKSERGLASKIELAFAHQFLDSLLALVDEINDPFFLEATLSAEPVMAPCRALGITDSTLPGKATLVAFRIIMPIHVRSPEGQFTFSPLNLFQTQQCVYPGAVDHEVFARQIHRELASVVETSQNINESKTARTKFGSLRDSLPLSTFSAPSSPPLGSGRDSAAFSSSKKKLWPFSSHSHSSSSVSPSSSSGGDEKPALTNPFDPFQGILVSQSVSVDVKEVRPEDEVEMGELGTCNVASTEQVAHNEDSGDTWVGDLLRGVGRPQQQR